MLAGRRALSCIALLATVGCNLDNPGDPPPRGVLYFPNALALSAHDATTPASHLMVANSDFDLRYRDGTVQSYSLDALSSAMAQAATCTPGPDCIIDQSEALVDETLIGAFSTSMALSSDGSAMFIATRTDDNLSFVLLAPGGQLGACGGRACSAQAVVDAAPRSVPLAWPGNPVAVIAGPLSWWAKPGQSASGDFVMVAHRAGSVSLFTYGPEAGGTGAPQLRFVDVLSGLSPGLTEMAYDASTGLVHMTIAGVSAVRTLARVGIAIPEGSADPASSARLYDAGAIGLGGVASGNDSRDLTFTPGSSAAGVALSNDRALVLSTDPSALLVVDVHIAGMPVRAGRVERTVAVAAGPQRIVTGVVAGRPLAVIACFDARELYVVDLDTMLVRSVVPNLSGPFDLALDEARKLVYLTDFRSSVIRVIDLAPAVDETAGEGRPVRVIATMGHPQILPELQ